MILEFFDNFMLVKKVSRITGRINLIISAFLTSFTKSHCFRALQHTITVPRGRLQQFLGKTSGQVPALTSYFSSKDHFELARHPLERVALPDSRRKSKPESESGTEAGGGGRGGAMSTVRLKNRKYTSDNGKEWKA